MPSTTRRVYLASLEAVTVGALAGCSALSDDSPPAGSLRFENAHDLPHALRFEVIGVGAEPGDDAGEVSGDITVPAPQRNLTASMTVTPGETEIYEDIFTEAAWYGVRFWLDDTVPDNNAGVTRFNPATADGGAWEYLVGHIYESGEFSWEVHSTEDSGQFN